MRTVQIVNQTRELSQPLTTEYADSFVAKLRGLAFRRKLEPDHGLLLVDAQESKINAGIHMLGMNFDLSIAWLDANLKVVDVRPAYRWRSFLLPHKPARYVLEFHASRLKDFRIGDQVALKEQTST